MDELDGSENTGRATKHLEFSPFHIDPEDVRILLSYKVIVESGGVHDHFILNDAAAAPGVIGIDLEQGREADILVVGKIDVDRIELQLANSVGYCHFVEEGHPGQIAICEIRE